MEHSSSSSQCTPGPELETEFEIHGYKELYHASVERCGNLQLQLDKCSQLLSKHKKIAELKDKAVSNVMKNKDLVELYHRNLLQKETEWQEELEGCRLRETKWEQECIKLQEQYQAKELECEELRAVCGESIARAAIARAESTARQDLIEDINTKKKAEIEKMKRKFSKYSQALTRKHVAVKESLEFTEAERDALLDANTELESQLKVVRGQLEEYRLTHQNPRSESSESRVELPPPVSVPDNLPPSPCDACQPVRKQLELALQALNDRGCTKYGDMLQSNFFLQQKVQTMESRLSEGMQAHQRNMEYIQEYKARSTEKVTILKKNIKRADAEIAELDKLIDMTREAMHESMHLVKQSPQLLMALSELDGTN